MGLSKNGRQSTAPRGDHKPTGAVKPSDINRPKGGGTKDFFSGELLYRPGIRRYYPFILYCCLLVIVYMGYTFNAQRTLREEISSRLRLQQLRSEALLLSSKRLDAVRYINLEEEIKSRKIELRQNNIPPVVIRKDERPER